MNLLVYTILHRPKLQNYILYINLLFLVILYGTLLPVWPCFFCFQQTIMSREVFDGIGAFVLVGISHKIL